MNALIVAGDDRTTAQVIDRYLQSRPALADAIAAAGACIVVFGTRWCEPGQFFVAMQDALDRAEAALPANARPLFVGSCVAGDLVATGMFRLVEGGPTRVACRQLRVRRGALVGYIAYGEGGLSFFDGRGRCSGNRPTDDVVSEALRAIAK